MLLLENKTAIVYGAAGAVGSETARTFAREGAHVFLTGRRRDALEKVAGEIRAAGGRAEVALVDALDREQVEQHAAEVASGTGGIDVSISAISIHGTVMGKPLLEMSVEDFATPVTVAATASFVTSTAVARHMVARGSGTILTLSTSSARLSGRDQRFHATGGFSVACGAVETFTRNLAAEVGPHGVRVVCLRPDALPETWSPEHNGTDGGGGNEFLRYMTDGTVLGRMPRVAEVAETAAFLGSGRASAITGTVVNLSCGSVLD